MKTFIYPLQLQFHIATLSNDFSITDANGKNIAYVRQKMLRLREKVEVFEDTGMSNKLYNIQTNQWLDFSTTYEFTNQERKSIGKVARKGWASLWRARYHIFNKEGRDTYMIREENGWVKVMDSFFGEIPVLGIFTGYFFNPSYAITDNEGKIIAQLKKQPSFWGRKFSLEKFEDLSLEDEESILLSCMMMLLLERRRG